MKMTMTMSSLRIPEELAEFFDKVAQAYPEKFPTKADAMRAALEFYADFHTNAPNIERNLINNFQSMDPHIQRMVLDIPKDHYNNLREIQHMGRGVSVSEIIRTFLRKYIRGESKAVLREKEDLRRALESARAHDTDLNLRDTHLTK
jgi:Arc/MetJ-type ribon-helix-helix transcriptional regulator